MHVPYFTLIFGFCASDWSKWVCPWTMCDREIKPGALLINLAPVFFTSRKLARVQCSISRKVGTCACTSVHVARRKNGEASSFFQVGVFEHTLLVYAIS